MPREEHVVPDAVWAPLRRRKVEKRKGLTVHGEEEG